VAHVSRSYVWPMSHFCDLVWWGDQVFPGSDRVKKVTVIDWSRDFTHCRVQACPRNWQTAKQATDAT
jgi:hypothetical protein